MQSYARPSNGVVMELWPSSPDAPMIDPQPLPVAVFGPDLGSEFVACGSDVQPGWTYDGKVFAAPVTPPTPTPAPQTVFPFRDFINLFTQSEQIDLFKARTDQSNPTLAVQVDMFITLAAAGPVDVTNAMVIQDVDACVQAGSDRRSCEGDPCWAGTDVVSFGLIPAPSYMPADWRQAGDDWAGDLAFTYIVWSVAPVIDATGSVVTPGVPMIIPPGATVTGIIFDQRRQSSIVAPAGSVVDPQNGIISLSLTFDVTSSILPQPRTDWGDIIQNYPANPMLAALLVRPILQSPNRRTIGIQPVFVF